MVSGAHQQPSGLSFVADSLGLVLSGRAHSRGDPPPRGTWRVAMGLSCASYLLPALVWQRWARPAMAALFVLVAICSTLSDAVRVDRNIVRSVDRAVGAVALSSSCVINSNTTTNTILCIGAVVTSLWWLRASRAATGTPQYLPTHCIWHLWGALAVCIVTELVQRQQGHG
jgi:hypothetical protein